MKSGWAKCLALLAASAWCARAEQGILVLYVADVQGRALSNVSVSVKGDGGMDVTKQGKARIRLAPQTQIRSWVDLALLSPANLVFISPWDGKAQVPSFENESANYVSVVVAERGDRRLLEDPAALHAMVKRANDAAAPRTAGEKDSAERAAGALKEVAQQFNLPPEEIDRAIRAWGQKAVDPYDKGLAELYARNFAASTRDLTTSVQMAREQALQDLAKLVDRDKSLGQSLRAEGKYNLAAAAYEEANRYRPDDPLILNEWGLSLDDAGDYAAAEPLLRRSLSIGEKALGTDHPTVATILNNLAAVLDDKGDYVDAEPLYRRALALDEKALGPDHPTVATRLSNLAELLREKGDYAGAEPLYRRALSIDEKTLGTDHPNVAIRLGNLAALLYGKGDYAEAEPLFRRALAIDEKALGPDHPFVATSLNNLGNLLSEEGDYADAEPLYRRALAINEKALGPGHPNVAAGLSNLAALLSDEGDYTGAEPLYRRALAIDEKVLGPDHPGVAIHLNNLAELLQTRGDYAGAEPLYQRALAIDEKVLGPDHPSTKTIRANLDDLLKKKVPQ